MLVGKAQRVYSSLSIEQSSDYDVVKSAILRAYELVPEAYRLRFRRYRKADRQTYVEFAREKKLFFTRWCAAQNVTDYAQLCQLMLLEEFKDCLPEVVAMYISEQRATTMERAAVLADEYALTHKIGMRDYRPRKYDNVGKVNLSSESSSPRPPDRPQTASVRLKCNYCKKPDHLMADCLALKRKNAKGTGLITIKRNSLPAPNVGKISECDESEGYEPFVRLGYVSLAGGNKQAVRILRDTGASQSMLLEGILPLSDKSALGTNVLVRGIGMTFIPVPLHKIHLESDLISDCVVVGIRPSLPVEGIDFILGNDIGGGDIWGTSIRLPEVVAVPLSSDQDECGKRFPNAFPSCAITRAMSKQNDVQTQDRFEDLQDTFLADLHSGPIANCDFNDIKRSDFNATKQSDSNVTTPVSPALGLGKEEKSHRLTENARIPVSREKLIESQVEDKTLVSLFESACPSDHLVSQPPGYFFREGVLMRKWRPPKVPDDWQAVSQIVVPTGYRGEILKVAHDAAAGHLGVTKTYDRVLRHFYWPGLKKDVRHFCKTCHICQLIGKPNQKIPPAPLYPIPVINDPFEHVIIDCVGPLPRSASGHVYLLTLMCANTRFPEVVPLRRITTKTVTQALIKFFSLVGLPKVIQSDRGSNFTSKVFARVLKQLGIKHNLSSAFHPESQGALERYHQTFKSMLKAYCLELGASWEEGVPWLLLASREVVQESTGFSPAELVFCHTPRGPLAVLKDAWLSESNPRSVLQHVGDIRSRLFTAREMAKKHLQGVQTKMKKWYDVKAKSRVFEPGDRVLLLLPVLGSSLQSRFSGPYTVQRKVSDRDYVIQTPDRRQSSRLCHINMLKPYFTRESDTATLSAVLKTETPPAKVVMLSSLIGTEEDDITDPSRSVPVGRLTNSEMLSKLPEFLSYLPPGESGDIQKLIHEFENLFGDVPSQTHVLEHDIDVGTSPPIKQHPYRVNPRKRAHLQREVEYMLEHNIAEPSASAWSSPCLLVGKSDGSLRFCTDYRRVNSVTKPDCFPLPRADDCIDRVGAAVYVSKFDMLKGYWQVPLTARAREISAFVTPDAFLSYQVMPFGMRNAPASFQRLVNIVLNGMSDCEAFLDDIVLYSQTWPIHLCQMRELFRRLSEANLTLNLAKCEFAKAVTNPSILISGSPCWAGVVCALQFISLHVPTD